MWGLQLVLKPKNKWKSCGMWSRGYSQCHSSTAPFFTTCCCDRILPHSSLLHFQMLSTQCVALYMDKHLVKLWCAMPSAWIFSSNIICLLAWSCHNSTLFGNNGGLTHFILWSTLVHPGFITINRQPITGCHTQLFSVLIGQTDPTAVTELLPENCMATIYWNTDSLTTNISIA
jgi:hypothetical protein